MGIIMAICELETKNALCKELKQQLIKIHLPSVDGYENLAEFDWVVDLAPARKTIGDWESFIKRNRLTDDVQAIYLDKLKKDEDIVLLKPLAEKRYNGWIDMQGLSEDERVPLINRSQSENRVTGWDMLSFDELNDTCSRCTLSWDKKRGCIGAFGPENSLLPEIASRRSCPIIASVFDGVRDHRRYTPIEAQSLIEEVDKLKLEMPEEGKMMVRRYEGPLERMKAMAEVCASEGCHFHFF